MTHSATRGVKPWFIALIVGSTVVVAVVLPLPSWMLARSVLLGLVAGLLWLPRVPFLSWIGLGLMLLSIPLVLDSAYRRVALSGAGWQSRWEWELTLVAWGTVALAVSLPDILRRIRKNPNDTWLSS